MGPGRERASPGTSVAGLGRNRMIVRAVASSAITGLIHISDTWLLAGSAALALAVPVALGSISMGRVHTLSPSDASILLSTGTNIKLVDVRSRGESSGDEDAAAPPAAELVKRRCCVQLAACWAEAELAALLRLSYSREELQRDVTSGLVVGVIALALGMALGIASDSTPAAGIYTVIVGGFLVRSHLGATHGPSLALALGCFALIRSWPKEWAKVLPQPVVAIAAGTLALAALQAANPGVELGIETIGSHFGAGAIPQSLPSLHWPEGVTAETIPRLLVPAATIAMLAAIESLLCARVADGMIGDKHDSNTELMSQAYFDVTPAKWVDEVQGVWQLGNRFLATGRQLCYWSYHLKGRIAATYVRDSKKGAGPRNDANLFLVAFSLTVLMDVAVAVAFGMAIALGMFVQDVSATMYVRALPPRSLITPPDHEQLPGPGETGSGGAGDWDPYRRSRRSALATSGVGCGLGGVHDEGEHVEGPQPAARSGAAGLAPLGSGGAGYLSVVPAGVVYVEVLVLNLSRVPVVDVSGLEVLEGAAATLAGVGKRLVLCGLTRQPLRMMARAGFLDQARAAGGGDKGRVGRENVCRSVEAALERAATVVAAKRARRAALAGAGALTTAAAAAAADISNANSSYVVVNGFGNGNGNGNGHGNGVHHELELGPGGAADGPVGDLPSLKEVADAAAAKRSSS
ncbi:putative sulfate transporter yvdB [Tetrabaena socialis]|uniref:Putative sulfate transporter yvdB n=1 Tax=Tetrabaena socialis TaxID=47790 RepID=A0A2J7ZQB1_9CHLO|nr:putative sulfate transporter yvdB [Tetrabaena socialis]|eukprot:PNH02451.1 putative sulfate transporter yvdB [Tetrabaena socialis]